jgi:transposase
MSTPDSSTAGNARSLRGLHIALNSPIKQTKAGWIVPSQSGSGKYVVSLSLDQCTCLDFETSQAKCKHIYAVEHTLSGLEGIDEEPDLAPRPARATYSQPWTEYNAAQRTEKANLQRFLHDLCSQISEPEQTMGRPRQPLGDLIFCAAFKVYSRLSGRRFTSDLEDAHSKGYISKVPHYNTIFKYLDRGDLTPIIREFITLSSLPLKTIETDFAVDSSGFSTNRFVRWYNAKYGREVDNQDWLKVHLMCGVRTNVVTSVEISGRHDHDAPFFPGLLGRTATNFRVLEVSADKAYSSRANLHAAMSYGATPYIPFKSNATGEAGGDQLWKIMYHYYSMRRDEFLRHYHKRSNAETTFSMIKGKFGDAVKGKTETTQTNEILLKILCHNLCVLNHSMHELGIETLWADSRFAYKVG